VRSGKDLHRGAPIGCRGNGGYGARGFGVGPGCADQAAGTEAVPTMRRRSASWPSEAVADSLHIAAELLCIVAAFPRSSANIIVRSAADSMPYIHEH